MLQNLKYLLSIFVVVVLISCNGNNNKSDAYGNFEAAEVLVSAENAGKLLEFSVSEGMQLEENQKVGTIDSLQIYYKLKQVMAGKRAVSTKTSNITAQINVLKEQKKTLVIEKNRIEKLLKDAAATQQQLDNITGQINIIEKQIESIESQNSTILSELESFDAQINQLQDQLNKCRITNTMKGTVVKKFAEAGEIVSPGKPLYKVADLSTMELRAYISGSQLSAVKIGQKVKVFIDKNENEVSPLEGEISWISEQAEFTPKIIQTKEERVNLVYAIKIKVRNNGEIKIGMPGEVIF